MSPEVLSSGSLHTFCVVSSQHSLSLPFQLSFAPTPPPPPRFLTSAPFLSHYVYETSSHSPASAWAEESMSDRASYSNHWPIPQPPFGLWPRFPRLWAESFISADQGPWGRNDSCSLGLQPLNQLRLQSWQIILLLHSPILTSSVDII